MEGKTPPHVEWNDATRSLGSESGDQYLVYRTGDGGVLVAVADGLGHGPEAASGSGSGSGQRRKHRSKRLTCKGFPRGPHHHGMNGTSLDMESVRRQ